MEFLGGNGLPLRQVSVPVGAAGEEEATGGTVAAVAPAQDWHHPARKGKCVTLRKLAAGLRTASPANILLLSPGFVLTFAFVIAPLAICLFASFVFQDAWSVENYRRVLLTSPYVPVLGFTLLTSLIVAVLAVAIAFPACALFNRPGVVVPGLFLALLTVSFTISVLVRTYAWHVVFAYNGVINNLLISLGLVEGRQYLLYTKLSVISALVQIMTPYAALIVFAGMRQVDNDVILAARTLGAGRVRTFVSSFWPQIQSHVVMALLIVFATTSGFFVTPALLGGPGSVMIGMQMHHDLVHNYQDGAGLAAASAVTLSTILLIIAALAVKASGKSFLALDRDLGK